MRAIKYQGLRNIRLQKQEADVRALTNGSRPNENGNMMQGLLSNLIRGMCLQRSEDLDAIRVVVGKNNKIAVSSWLF